MEGLHEDVHPCLGEETAFVCDARVLWRVQQMMERLSCWDLSSNARNLNNDTITRIKNENDTHINPSLPLAFHCTRLIHIARRKLGLRLPPMPTQPHPPPHRIPPPTLLVPRRDPQLRRRLPFLRGLITFVREIDPPRAASRPVPACATRESGCLSLVELVVVCLGRPDGIWTRNEGEMGWDTDFANFAAGYVEEFRWDRGKGWA